MKIPADIQLVSGPDYCSNCFKTTLEVQKTDEGKLYVCRSCGFESNRRISIESSMRWHLDEDRNLWHESVGVFAFDPQGKFLTFELTKYPFGFTVPAGHHNSDEDAETAVRRELAEETGLRMLTIRQLGEADIIGDSCGRGADAHKWTAFTCITDPSSISLDASEGKNAQWLSPEEASQRELTVPVQYFFDTYRSDIDAASEEAKKQSNA